MIEETEGEMEYRIEDETMADAMDIAIVIICLVVLFMFTSCCLWFAFISLRCHLRRHTKNGTAGVQSLVVLPKQVTRQKPSRRRLHRVTID